MINKKQGKMNKHRYAIPSERFHNNKEYYYYLNSNRSRLFKCVGSKKSEVYRYELNFEGTTP